MGILTNGVKQWVFQRVSNAVFVIFGITFLTSIVYNGASYESLSYLFDSMGFKFFALLTLILISTNSILAGWQITGDYAAKFNVPACWIMSVTVIVGLTYFFLGCMLLL